MAELALGNPVQLATDVGPVITAKAQGVIEAHVAAMAARGFRVHRVALPEAAQAGTFVAPTLIEVPGIDALGREVFGPVLHVVRYAARDLEQVIAAVNATGYGLTFGLHTRLDETVERVTGAIDAGNLYVNVHVAPDATFARRGRHLTTTVRVSFPDAALGTTVEVPTLDEPVTVKVPAGTQPGTTLRVRGRGVPAAGKHPVGDLLVTVSVDVPRELTGEQRRLIEKLRSALGEESAS
jgi:hypothetical protein